MVQQIRDRGGPSVRVE
ncbi:hypothetical protein LINGRAHAP2_LOCUS4303 [Linum grandiflorum]